MGHLGKITSVKDLPPDRILIGFIQQAMKLNEMGIKEAVKKPSDRKPLTVPLHFKNELAKNTMVQAIFDNFSYSHKKEYLEWITEAKTEATRLRRMTMALEWIEQGKDRNWKYERK